MTVPQVAADVQIGDTNDPPEGSRRHPQWGAANRTPEAIPRHLTALGPPISAARNSAIGTPDLLGVVGPHQCATGRGLTLAKMRVMTISLKTGASGSEHPPFPPRIRAGSADTHISFSSAQRSLDRRRRRVSAAGAVLLLGNSAR